MLIASPSDVDEERDVAVRVIQEWNDLHSFNRKVTLLPLRWETHTAPDYGTRPQEVVNRAVVDHCDLLIGIFWTRIGSPTGEADSGTLEEIDRVGQAGEPIMLYFSKVGVDPDAIDLNQVQRLKNFKETTYPRALIESYKSTLEFRDKLAKQLELKVRELQKADTTGEPTLALRLYSPEASELTERTQDVSLPVVKDLDSVVRSNGWEQDHEKVNKLQELVERYTLRAMTLPVVLAVRNDGVTGVRNLFGEVTIRANQSNVSVVEHAWTPADWSFYSRFEDEQRALAQLNERSLTRDEKGWSFAFEWGAVQPKRTRYVERQIFLASPESGSISFAVKLYADSFPQPIDLEATLTLNVIQAEVEVEDLIPRYIQQVSSPRSVNVGTISFGER